MHIMGRVRRRDGSRRALAAVAGLLLLLALPVVALADTELVASVPADGQVLTTVPPEAVLTFDEPVTSGSTFAVLDASGATVASGAPDAADAAMMRGALPALSPGIFEIQWAAGSTDGHIVRGTFQFTVAEPTPPPATPAPTDAPTVEPTATATSTATPPDTPTDTPTPSPGDGATGGAAETDVVLPILVVVVLVGAGLAVMLRRRGPA